MKITMSAHTEREDGWYWAKHKRWDRNDEYGVYYYYKDGVWKDPDFEVTDNDFEWIDERPITRSQLDELSTARELMDRMAKFLKEGHISFKLGWEGYPEMAKEAASILTAYENWKKK